MDNPSRYFPIKNNENKLFKLFLKKPLYPDLKEIEKNNRSRSAKLRYAIRNNNSFVNPNEFNGKFLKVVVYGIIWLLNIKYSSQ